MLRLWSVVDVGGTAVWETTSPGPPAGQLTPPANNGRLQRWCAQKLQRCPPSAVTKATLRRSGESWRWDQVGPCAEGEHRGGERLRYLVIPGAQPIPELPSHTRRPSSCPLTVGGQSGPH
ncbi:hypothetical protein NDU88_000879 [Pleurodeles waltl]|uniref:Uncharacterized protein n=1 Tax=Pleurodeles waltl TaxID=8319 RepID=A0AAV7V7X4_PLEWA|nr:hypothetical protein NDU88_000879 [Pleurodeles waltl]